MPPRENPRVNKSLDSVHASGPLGRAHCVIHGNSNYQQTGLLQAYAAYSLLQTPPKRVGFASGCQAFGHQELLGVLRSFGLVSEPQLTMLTEGVTCDWSTTSTRAPRSVRTQPCLTTDGETLSYAEVQELSYRIAAGLAAGGVRPAAGGDPVGERPDRVQLRVRDQPGRCGLVPDQPAQRGGGEPRAARPVRL